MAVPHVYAAGRLDRDSEGLLVLTSSGALQSRLAEPRHKLPKLYWVQVEGAPSEEQLAALRAGVTLSDGPTLPLAHDDAVLLVDGPPVALWPREPPIRQRLTVPTAWLQLRLHSSVTALSLLPPPTNTSSRPSASISALVIQGPPNDWALTSKGCRLKSLTVVRGCT